MKSGYSTTILVHKEGIMTNEEIYKYADKALKNQENRVLLSTWLPLVIGLFGLSMILFVFDSIEYSCVNSIIILALLIVGGIMLLLAANIWGKWFKIRRNYIYNLVRQDERNKISDIISGEHEGSR